MNITGKRTATATWLRVNKSRKQQKAKQHKTDSKKARESRLRLSCVGAALFGHGVSPTSSVGTRYEQCCGKFRLTLDQVCTAEQQTAVFFRALHFLGNQQLLGNQQVEKKDSRDMWRNIAHKV